MPSTYHQLERFSFVLRTSWAWAGWTILQAPKERQFIAWGVSPRTRRHVKRSLSQPRRGDRREPWPSPPVAPIRARNGEAQGSLGDILGLTPPGYELSPLRGWGKRPMICTRESAVVGYMWAMPMSPLPPPLIRPGLVQSIRVQPVWLQANHADPSDMITPDIL